MIENQKQNLLWLRNHEGCLKYIEPISLTEDGVQHLQHVRGDMLPKVGEHKRAPDPERESSRDSFWMIHQHHSQK